MENSNLKTHLRNYFFDTSNPEQAAEYQALCAHLKGQGLKCFETWGGGSHYLKDLGPRCAVELETKHLFDNQWNTAPLEEGKNGLRVFDWAQDAHVRNGAPGAVANKHIKQGHYLEQTPEMEAARASRLKCGYCGFQTTEAAPLTQCPKCLDSTYLDEDTVKRGGNRLYPVVGKTNWTPLTPEEWAACKPDYVAAQLQGAKAAHEKELVLQKARLERHVTEVQQKAAKLIKNAETECEGMLWLLERGFLVDNVIYYSHVDTFSFGWKRPVSDCVRAALLEVMSEFPFSYEIKCEGGETLEAKR